MRPTFVVYYLNALITNKRTSFDVYSTRSVACSPSAFCRIQTGTGTQPLVHVYFTRRYRSLYLLDVIQPVAFLTDAVWPGCGRPAFLHLHGFSKNTVEGFVAAPLAPHSRAHRCGQAADSTR